MPSRAEIVTTAREYINTPFFHEGRVKGENGGVDCIGLLTGVAQEHNLTDHDFHGYPRQPDGVALIRELDIALEPTNGQQGYEPEWDVGEYGIGDVLVFWIRNVLRPKHVAIVCEGFARPLGLIHTWYEIGHVVEHDLDDRWLKRIAKAYRFPRVSD